MVYFTALSLALGTALIFSRPLLDTLSRRWAAGELDSREGPRWTRPVSVLPMGMIGLSWYHFLTDGMPIAIIATLAVTVVMYRLTKALLDYPRLRIYVVKVLNVDPRRKERVTERMMIVGAALVILGVLAY